MRSSEPASHLIETATSTMLFLKAITRVNSYCVIEAALKTTSPLSLLVTIHHDSICPCHADGSMRLGDLTPETSIPMLNWNIEHCLCEIVDLTLMIEAPVV